MKTVRCEMKIWKCNKLEDEKDFLIELILNYAVVLQYSRKIKNKTRQSSTNLLKEWHLQMLHVSIPKE
jgi:hypothetical protein